MDNVILLKRSSVPSFTPSVTSLSAGELAVNVSDGALFTKRIVNGVEGIVTFLNSEANPYSYNPSFSSIVVAVSSHNNTVSQVFATVLGGYYNDVSGGGSTVINGENNDIAGDYALIGGGSDNLISSSGDYGAILGGKDNTLNHQESFIIGSNITSHASNFTYVNNLSATGLLYGDGSNLTGIITNSTLLATVTSDVTVGGIEQAQIILKDTTLQQFVETLLTKIYYPVITAPLVSMSSNHSGGVECGTQGVVLTVNFNRGAITGKTVSGVWDPNYLQNYRAGDAIQYTILNQNNGTENSYTSAAAIIQEGTNLFNGQVSYDIGFQPLDSKEQIYLTPLAASTLSTTTSVFGRRKAFYGVNNSASNSEQIRLLESSTLNPINNTTFNINIPIGTSSVVFAYPSTLRNVTSVLYKQGFDADVKDVFALTPVLVEGANGYLAIDYKVYRYVPVVPFTQAATYKVTI